MSFVLVGAYQEFDFGCAKSEMSIEYSSRNINYVVVLGSLTFREEI